MVIPEKQNLAEQNQTPIMSNASHYAFINEVFKYEEYIPNYRKSKIKFKNVQLKAAGKLGFKIGNQVDESCRR